MPNARGERRPKGASVLAVRSTALFGPPLASYTAATYLHGLQFLSRGPESLAVRFAHPVLRELIGRRAPRADDRAFAGLAVDSRANLQDETVRRAGLRGAA